MTKKNDNAPQTPASAPGSDDLAGKLAESLQREQALRMALRQVQNVLTKLAAQIGELG
jgi:hypothetical protein